MANSVKKHSLIEEVFETVLFNCRFLVLLAVLGSIARPEGYPRTPAPWDRSVSRRGFAALIRPAQRKYRSISHRSRHINPQNCANVISPACTPQ